ncbi:MAG: hypothetical protein ACLQU2_06165 [Candidatus Binataceae bacterium]
MRPGSPLCTSPNHSNDDLLPDEPDSCSAAIESISFARSATIGLSRARR